MGTVDNLFFESLREFIHRLVDFIPNILVMFAVVLTGVVLSAVVRLFLYWILTLLKFDSLAERAGISQILDKGGIRVPPSRIVTSISYWGILLVFFMMGFVALDVDPINNLIKEFFSYLPNVAASAVILTLGFLIGNFVERAAIVAAGNAGISRAELIGKGIRLFIAVMTAAMALEQLGIARGIIIAAFSISFGGIVLAVSLAFGLGAKDLAKEFLEKRLKRRSSRLWRGRDEADN